MMTKILKRFTLGVLGVVIAVLLFVGGYVGYVSIQFYRMEDALELTESVTNNNNATLQTGVTYSALTYNIGFGAYTREFTFFMDSGVMKDGTPVQGSGSKAASKEEVLENTIGSIRIASHFDVDFLLFQEVDIKSTRSHKVNQYEMLVEAFSDYASSFALNFHSAYLLYPFHDPHGKVTSGISTHSRFQIEEAIRYKLPIDESFFNKFFDLDRCIMVTRTKVTNDKDFVLINVHLSAYDEGGIIRAMQLEVLKNIMEEEYAKGNYVMVGGDFNHDIAGTIDLFPTEQEIPEWVFVLEENQLPTGFRFATSNLHPTCRSTDISFEEGVNYTVVIDGFIVSENIEIELVENVVTLGEEDVNFLYSDHNAVVLYFHLKP